MIYASNLIQITFMSDRSIPLIGKYLARYTEINLISNQR